MSLPEYRSAEKGACDSCGAERVTIYDVSVASDGWQCAVCVLDAAPAALDLTDADDLARRYSVALSALAAERERAQRAEEDNAVLLAALRSIDYGCDWMPERIQRLLNRIQQAEHPGRALMARYTQRVRELEQREERALICLNREIDALRQACEELITAMVQLDKEHHREVTVARSVLGIEQ